MKAEVVDTRQMLDGALKVEEVGYRYEKFDGQMSEPIKRTIVKRGDAVAAIVFNTDSREVIFVKQFRYAAFERDNGWLTEIMAGVMDEGETEKEALEREMEEEMGYAPVLSEKIGTFYVSPGYTTERMHLYYVEVNEKSKIANGGGLEEESEDIQLVNHTIEEIRQMVSANDIMDLKTIVACHHLLARG